MTNKMNNEISPPKMVSVAETASIFGITQYYARQLALSGTVKAVRVGRGKILINYQSVCEYFNTAVLNDAEEIKTTGIRPVKL